MPNIPVYESKAALEGLRPSNLGVEAFEQEGRRVGQFYHQIGEAVGGGIKDIGEAVEQHQTQSFVLAAGRHLAEMQANHQAAWNAFVKSADLSDHTKVQAFRDGMEKDYSDFVAAAPNDKARVWATQQVNSQREGMYRSTAADASAMAGANAAVSHATMLAVMGSNVYNDVTTLGPSIAQMKAVNEAAVANSNVSVERAAQIREQETTDAGTLTFNAIRGAIFRNPAEGEKLVDGLAEANLYLNPTQRAELHSYAQEQTRAKEHDQAWQDAQVREQQSRDWDKQWTVGMAKGYQPDGSWVAPKGYFQWVTEMAGQPGADAAKVEVAMNRGRQALEDQVNGTLVQDDPSVAGAMFARLAKPPGDPNVLTEAEIETAAYHRQISNKTASQLREGLTRRVDPAYSENWSQLSRITESFKTSFTKTNPLAGKIDFSGDQAFGKFQQAVFNAWNAELAAGKKPAEAEADLSNPSSPNYVGRLVDRLRPTDADRDAAIQRWSGGSASPKSKRTDDLATKLVP